MLLNIIYLLVGLGLILWGANALTDGASAVAKKFGVSDLVIGLTIIGFGTSAPELSVSVLSAFHGSPGMAIGNVVGSNIFDILLIIGLTAMIMPIRVGRDVVSNDMPMVVWSSGLLLIMGNAVWLDGAKANVLTRIDGILLLFFFAAFMRMVLRTAKTQPQLPSPAAAGSQAPVAPASATCHCGPAMPIWKAMAFVVLGLVALIFGADKFVSGASYVAKAMGVSEAVIGLTIVAAGTSLPELATSIASAIKRKPGLAVGNIVGSCVFNALFILGATATYRPLPFADINNVDLGVLVLASVLFWLFARYFGQRGERVITRLEGGVMVAIYVAYTTYLILRS